MQRDLGGFRWWAAEEGNRRRKSRTKVGGGEKGGATPECGSGSTEAPDQGGQGQ